MQGPVRVGSVGVVAVTWAWLLPPAYLPTGRQAGRQALKPPPEGRASLDSPKAVQAAGL